MSTVRLSGKGPTTVSYDENIAEMLRAEPEFRQAYLEGIVQSLLEGETDIGQSMLRKYVAATIGFKKLEKKLHRAAGSLEEALRDESKPLAADLFAMLAYLQRVEGGMLEVVRRAA